MSKKYSANFHIKKFGLLLLIVLLTLGIIGCAAADKPAYGAKMETKQYAITERSGLDNMRLLKITVNGKVFNVHLNDNTAVQKLMERLPFKLTMKDLHNNEKYYYLDYNLPGRAEKVGKISAGDLMLFGNDCLVVFYKSFDTPYSYTKLGKIENAAELEKVLGRGSVEMEFSL